ncbi:response regulator [Microbulbifer yueqingensis]|uniref:Response regulator receiver domain-containing protein n=1 Tax=Microbulbifer yueqingensis TaxID=658219 RepID=A0A1G9CP09_9GAMM|nr:response regulator [Microbulbifer yueqingensis]SDK53337.1 Response regulator receiver domain-containing protein [Microbulbifer yueqingensis]
MINTIYRGRRRVCAPVAALLTSLPAAAAAAPLIDALTESRVALAWPLALLAALLVAVTTAILLQSQARRQQLELASASERLGNENRKLHQQLQSHRTQLGKFEQQLSESRDSVELLRQQRNDLQAVIVHRLQRPLEAVQGTLNLLLRGGDPETAGLAEMAQRQLEGARQALKQVNPGASANGAGEQPGRGDARHVSSLSVLLVENEEQDSLQPALEQRGHRVVRTTSGTDGADAALREKFDLVLLDCDLRPLDCVTVTRKIRAEHGRGLPIFVIVTALLGGEKERYQAEGLTGVLSRPVMDAQLQQLLNWTARRGRRQPQSTGTPAQTRLLNTAVLNRQRDTLGTAVFSELLRGRIASLPKRVTSLTSALTGRHWLDAEQRARAAAASSEEIGLEAIAVRLRSLAESLAVDSEREYCRQQRTEILNLMRSSIQHLKAWRDQNVHASWALK